MEVGLIEDGCSLHMIKMSPHCQPSSACPLVDHRSAKLDRNFKLKTFQELLMSPRITLNNFTKKSHVTSVLSSHLTDTQYYQENIGAVLARLLDGVIVHQLHLHQVHTVVVGLQNLPGELHIREV